MKPHVLIWHIIKFPFLQVYRFIEWLIVDTIGDFKFIGKAITKSKKGVPVLDEDKVKEFKDEIKGILTGKYSIKDLMKSTWIWILVIAFAGVMGWILGVQYCEIECNNYIIEDILNNPMVRILNASDMSNYNLSNIASDPYFANLPTPLNKQSQIP